jgi:PTS system cellobiose-specific IIC component
LIVVNLLVAGIIYYPFVKAYDKKMVQDEMAQVEVSAAE